MWTCAKCLFENSDQHPACQQCGTPRAQRRFQQPAVQHAPYNSQNGPGFQRDTARMPRAAARPQRLPEMVLPPLSRAARLLRFCGGMLTFLLPVMCLLLCCTQFDVLYKALVPLLTGSEDKTFLGYLCYGLYALCAVLLSLFPGLSMLTMTGKYKKPALREDQKLL